MRRDMDSSSVETFVPFLQIGGKKEKNIFDEKVSQWVGRTVFILSILS